MRLFTLVLLVLTLPFPALAADPAAPEAGTPARLLELQAQRTQGVMEHLGQELRASLPKDWLASSVLGLERWQWAAVPIFLVLIALLTLGLERISTALVVRFNRSRPAVKSVLDRLNAPLRLLWGSLLARVTLPVLTLSAGTEALWSRSFRITFGLAFFWGALRALSAWSDQFVASPYAAQHPGSRSLVGLFTRLARFALIGFAVLATLSELGYAVSSVLAGLGIGGIALALGAQKTLENVFGAFALAVDQPIREGDLVKVGELVGNVESIGLRSTRIRTFERTVVSIPNGKLAELQLETFAARDRIRFAQKLQLAPDTTPSQLEKVLGGCRKVLAEHPKLFPDSNSVALSGFSLGSVDVDLIAAFSTADFGEFRTIREAVLLQCLGVLNDAKVQLAVPLPGK